MKIPCLPVLCSLAVATVAGCVKEDPAPQFVEAGYQLRCIDCVPISPDSVAHNLLALNGDNGFQVECTSHVPSKNRLLTFSAEITDKKHANSDFAFKIVEANIDARDPGAACKIQVREGGNTYEGGCTSGTPNDDQPCQLKISEKGGVVSGSVLCHRIPNRSDATLFRYLVAPNTDDDAADFDLHGCQL